MPCASALHLPLHGPVPSWALSWLEGAPLGDPHGEEKGDLGRGGNGWNMLGLEPALGIEVTCASDAAVNSQGAIKGRGSIRYGLVGCHPRRLLAHEGCKLTGEQQSCGLASFTQRWRGTYRPSGTAPL